MKRIVVCIGVILCALSAQLSLAAQEPLSRGFDDLVIGMDFESLTEALKAHAGFTYRGTPEVSLSPGGEEKIVETRGGRFIQRGIFQFADNKLFSISLDFNSRELDYYTLYTRFTARWGNPLSLDPRQAVWEDAEVRILLEKPLTLKYLSVPVMTRRQEKGAMEQSAQETSRESFIDKL